MSETKVESVSTQQLLNRINDLETEVKELREQVGTLSASPKSPEAISIVVFSGSLDRLLAAMSIATGAAAMGIEVRLFFTFWATAALRKGVVGNKQSFMEKAICWMLPSGTRDLKLSNMNCCGLGTEMIKRRMKEKNVSDLDAMLEMAKETGVRISICEMSMDLLGMQFDELIDYPDLRQCGVATFLGDSMDAKMTLFI